MQAANCEPNVDHQVSTNLCEFSVAFCCHLLAEARVNRLPSSITRCARLFARLRGRAERCDALPPARPSADATAVADGRRLRSRCQRTHPTHTRSTTTDCAKKLVRRAKRFLLPAVVARELHDHRRWSMARITRFLLPLSASTPKHPVAAGTRRKRAHFRQTETVLSALLDRVFNQFLFSFSY